MIVWQLDAGHLDKPLDINDRKVQKQPRTCPAARPKHTSVGPARTPKPREGDSTQMSSLLKGNPSGSDDCDDSKPMMKSIVLVDLDPASMHRIARQWN